MAQAFSELTGTPHTYTIEVDSTEPAIITRPIPEAIRTWLPAIVVLLCTPLMALLVTKYALIPPMRRALAPSASAIAPGRINHDQTAGAFFYTKLPLNNGATAGGFRSLALIGANKDFNSLINQNRAKLTAIATTALQDTSVSELDNPGALDATRAQLLTDLNHALGGQIIQEVYISEYPRK